MTKTLQHSLLFRLWVHLRGVIAIAIVALGIIIALISLILPNESLYKHYVVDFLSKQWDKKIEIEHITGKWKGFGPKFIIDGLTIKDEDEVIVQQATLKINILKLLIPKGSTGISLGINDIEVDFERKNTGEIVLTNNNIKKESVSDKLEKLLNAGTLSVNNLTFNLYDSLNKQNKKFHSKIFIQQSDDSRAFSLQLDSQDLAKAINIKAITQKSDDFMKKAKWYAELNDLSLSNLGKITNNDYLPISFVDAQLWFETEQGNISQMVGTAELKNKLFSDDAEITGLAELLYRGEKHNWNAELSIKNIKTESISHDEIKIFINRNNSIINLNAEILDIPLLKALTQVLNISSDEFNNFDLSGQLKNVNISYDVELRRIVDAEINFSQLDLKASIGDIHNLAGNISLHDDQIRLLIDSESGSANLPKHIRGNIKWEKLLLTAQTSMQDEDLDFKINSLWCDCNDFILDGAARISLVNDLFLDLSVAVYDAQVNQLYKYWPSIKWKPNVLNFLDQALVKGVVDKGMIIYHGMPTQYPFAQKQGVFLTHSHLIDATVNYHKDWPVVKEFRADVDTVNRYMSVVSKTGKVIKGNVDFVKATIKDLKNPYLKVDVYAHGKNNYLIDVLKQSSMKKGLKILNEDISLNGSQKLFVNLGIPLKIKNSKVEPKGTIEFIQTDFKIGQFQLDNLNGKLNFEGASLQLNDLSAKFLNNPVKVTGNITNKINANTQIDVLLKGNYSIKSFESLLGISLPAKGISQWDFTISNKDDQPLKFRAFSQLFGTQIKLPDPFDKKHGQSSPFSISCTLPCIESGWDLSFDSKIKTNFKLNTLANEFQLGQLIFGDVDKVDTDFGGQIDKLDVDKWINVIASNQGKNSKNKIPFEYISLDIKQAIFMERTLENIRLDITIKPDVIEFIVDSKNIRGIITIPNDINKKGIIVQLDKLHWLDSPPLSANSDNKKMPNNYPPMHIWIGDFIYDGMPLGEVSIEMRPVNEGMLVEKFTTQSDLLNLDINGMWFRNQGENGLSKFNIIMTSTDLTQLLAKKDFQAPLSQSEIIIDMQVSWDDFPSQFKFNKLNGTVTVNIGEGEVVDAKPGMGRVLGLFSLTNLPRRLILDFKDVFAKGLQFEFMQGEFTLKNGIAHTDEFIIDSTSAQILIKGNIDLDKEIYDQKVIITPRVGRILPTIGAITGGAVGAAAGFLVQGMFQKGLKNVGKIIYKVTGNWANPKITLIETKKINES